VLELDPHRHQQQPMGVQTLSKEAVVAPLPIFGIAHDRAQNMFHTEQRIQSGQSQATLGIGRGTRGGKILAGIFLPSDGRNSRESRLESIINTDGPQQEVVNDG
jgi:hypothetical protein